MNYWVTLSATAESEMDAVLEWLKQHSPLGAAKWLDALELALADLETDPQRFGIADESPRRGEVLYQHLFGTASGARYRLVYRVSGNRVDVLSIRSPGQQKLQN
jgi:plasmid stabilization system protein ParE